MTINQKRRLDDMWRIFCLQKWDYKSVLSGERTDIVHHFIGKRNEAVRWYIPNGIPLTHEEHQFLECNEREEQNAILIEKLGTVWYEDLIKQSNRIAKYLNVELIKAHLKGEMPHYIDGWYL